MPKDTNPATQPHPPPPPPNLNDGVSATHAQQPDRRQFQASGYTGGYNNGYDTGYNGGRLAPGPISRRESEELTYSIAKRFALNQIVSVNVSGCGWLVGTVVAILNTVKVLTGAAVKVKYIYQGKAKEDIFENNSSYIRAYEDHCSG